MTASRSSLTQELEGREEITMWFWGAEPYAQEAMKELLVDEYNASQDEYQLVVEFRPSVDADMNDRPGGEPGTGYRVRLGPVLRNAARRGGEA